MSDDIARILITEDSRSYALALRRFLEHDPDLKVVGTCGSVRETTAAVRRLKPDLLILDLELPDGSGLDVIPEVLAHTPLPIFILSDHAERGSDAAAAGLAAGAIDAHPKRSLDLRNPAHARGVMFRRYLKRLSRARVGGQRARRAPAPRRSVDGRRFAAIGICASTGGPAALRSVLGALPASFPIPVLVVQHITKGFMRGLVDWLSHDLSVPVRLAVPGAPLEPGVAFAPDGAHLAVDAEQRLRYDRDGSLADYHCPAADVLFASMATTLGASAAAVVLTGMGSDGAEGMAAVGAAGGLTIAQDEGSSAIYGMPRAAFERGAELVLPVEQIGPALKALTPAAARG